MLVSLAAAGAAGFAGASSAASPPAERYVVITNGVVVGHMHVTRRAPGAGRADPIDTRQTQRTEPSGTTRIAAPRAQHIDIDYRVDDNGRGPKLTEAMELQDGLPHRWSVQGRAESGAPVQESFEWRDRIAHWRTLSDGGRSEASRPNLYVPSDASPFALALYVRALTNAPQMTLPAWPGGELRAERIRDLRFGAGPTDVTVWALWGLELEPVLVMTDAQLRFVARLDAARLVIPADWIERSAELQALGASLGSSMLRELSVRLRHRSSAPLHLRNVRVLDPAAGALSPPSVLVVHEGRIAGVHRLDAGNPEIAGEQPGHAPADAPVVIDGDGGIVVPALFDMHGHVEPWQGPLYAAAGIATVRDMGNDNAELAKLAARYAAHELLGPRIVPAGFLEGRSPYSAQGGFVVGSLAQALEKVDWYADRGYRLLKIYNSIRPEWVAPIAARAHQRGLRVVGHVPAFMSSREAILAGYDEVSHLNQLLLSLMIDPHDDDTRTVFRFTALGERAGLLDLDSPAFASLVREMRSRRIALDPTLAILSHMMLARAGRTTPVTEPWLDHLPAPLARRGRSAFLDVPPEHDTAYRLSEARLLEATRRLHDAGVPLLPGTDYRPGFMLVSELEAWQRAGIAPKDILRLATIECARYLGMERELGTIEPGKQADLLLVAGDPTRDVGALRQVRLVLHEGAVLFPDEIHSALQVKPFVSRPSIVVPRAAPSGLPGHRASGGKPRSPPR